MGPKRAIVRSLLADTAATAARRLRGCDVRPGHRHHRPAQQRPLRRRRGCRLGPPRLRRPGRGLPQTRCPPTTPWTSWSRHGPSDTVTHRGHRVHTAPRPVQDPHPPLWIGGNGPRALERVNPIGTTWHPLHPGRQLCARAAGALADGKQFARGSSSCPPAPPPTPAPGPSATAPPTRSAPTSLSSVTSAPTTWSSTPTPVTEH